ncbi:hypothetical protein D3C76_1702570 [compost metagenome]
MSQRLVQVEVIQGLRGGRPVVGGWRFDRRWCWHCDSFWRRRDGRRRSGLGSAGAVLLKQLLGGVEYL